MIEKIVPGVVAQIGVLRDQFQNSHLDADIPNLRDDLGSKATKKDVEKIAKLVAIVVAKLVQHIKISKEYDAEQVKTANRFERLAAKWASETRRIVVDFIPVLYHTKCRCSRHCFYARRKPRAGAVSEERRANLCRRECVYVDHCPRDRELVRGCECLGSRQSPGVRERPTSLLAYPGGRDRSDPFLPGYRPVLARPPRGSRQHRRGDMREHGRRLRSRIDLAAAAVIAGLRATHGIPRSKVNDHTHWTGKSCPAKMRAAGRWLEFLNLSEGATPVSTMISPFQGRLTQNHGVGGRYRGHKGTDVAPKAGPYWEARLCRVLRHPPEAAPYRQALKPQQHLGPRPHRLPRSGQQPGRGGQRL